MKEKEASQNVRLGIFVVIGIVLFIVSIFYVGSEKNVFNRTFTISAVFKNVEGLKPGDNVWLSGVKIGTVDNIRIISEGKVNVDLALRDRQNEYIKKNATAFIGSDGLVGNKIVVIKPGNGAVIDDGDTINTYSPPDTQALFNLAKDVGDNTKAITADLKLISEKLAKGEGIVGELLHEGQMSKDIRKTVVSLKQTGENTAKATQQLNNLLTEMKSGDGLLPTLINDTSYSHTFGDALTNIKAVSRNSAVVAASLEQTVKKINDSNNALGVMLSDTVAARELKNTIQNAEQASKKLDENMEALQHNFLFRGYFRKKAKQEAKEAQHSK